MIDRSELLEDKRKLGEILSRDEFARYVHEQASGPRKGGVETLLDWVIERFPAFHGADDAAIVGLFALLAAVSVALCWGIYWFSRQLVFQGKTRRHMAPVGSSELELTYEQYAAMAKAAHAEGKIRESIRCSYLSLLFYMEQAGWIRIEKWKTDWDYRDELERSRASAVPYFQRSALLFERVWYGHEPADEDSFLGFQRDIDALIAEREAR